MKAGRSGKINVTPNVIEIDGEKKISPLSPLPSPQPSTPLRILPLNPTGRDSWRHSLVSRLLHPQHMGCESYRRVRPRPGRSSLATRARTPKPALFSTATQKTSKTGVLSLRAPPAGRTANGVGPADPTAAAQQDDDPWCTELSRLCRARGGEEGKQVRDEETTKKIVRR